MHTNARGIFSLSHISDVMHLVFDAPIASDALGKGLWGGQKRGNIVASFGCLARLSAVLEVSLTLYANQRLQSWPGLDVIEGCAKANDPLLQSSVPFTEVGEARLGNKISLDGFEQVTLIAFEGRQVMILGIKDELTGFFECSLHQRQSPRP